MKKLSVVFVIIALIVGGFLYLGSNLNNIVAGLIEEHGSAATKTPVNVAGVSINLSDANGGISSLTVGNPEGFAGNAIEMEAFDITLDPSSLTEDVVVIENILVKGARLNVIQQGGSNNLQQLLRNLDRPDSAEANDDGDEGKKIRINRFTLEGASASVSAPDFDQMREVTIPTMTLRNLGQGGATGTEIAKQVLEPVIQEAMKSAVAEALEDKVNEALEGAADSLLQGIFGSDEDEQQ